MIYWICLGTRGWFWGREMENSLLFIQIRLNNLRMWVVMGINRLRMDIFRGMLEFDVWILWRIKRWTSFLMLIVIKLRLREYLARKRWS